MILPPPKGGNYHDPRHMRIDPQFSLERWAKTYPFRQALVDQLVEAWRKAGLK